MMTGIYFLPGGVLGPLLLGGFLGLASRGIWPSPIRYWKLKQEMDASGAKPTVPWMKIVGWPSGQYIDEVLLHLKETAQPETLPSLFRNQIPKDEEFRIMKKDIELDGKKRPEGDNAPCLMCQPNKSLNCSLIYLPKMQCCAVSAIVAPTKKMRPTPSANISRERHATTRTTTSL